MEMRELTIQKREGVGKGPARRLRRAGQVPAILYGGAQPVNISVIPRDIYRLVHGHEGSTQLLRISFAGSSESRMAIIRDIQYDPVSEDLVHVDLQEVAMDRPIQVSVAVHHVGEAVGVKDTFGILEMILREVQVSCLPGNIPQVLDADVTTLRIGDVLTVKDLKAPEGVRILNDPNQAVATVAPPAAEEAAAPVAAAEVAAAPAEPEVLTERKPKEETEEKGGREEKKK
ncbi:MAG TPA: 50S ribosomal protein L25 [Methylomirabilota bacterium]|jgi:large subunit ribosomal protein L25|nr:50S ribosomal protein L25 [Methylomirabilota bacterium]